MSIILDGLNDFINPSQECIKPTLVNQVMVEQISLDDCLACSGCITSAESVLVAMQSHLELYKVLDAAQHKVCFTVSPQSIASIAAKHQLSFMDASVAINGFLKNNLSATHVFGLQLAKDLALMETASEFVIRFKNSIPTLVSSCPGFICYAEKTHPFILPFIDTTKSPQQIMGSFVKYHLASGLNLTPDQIYHVAIMPCYDKKLEASRTDFYNELYKTRDVDLVLTTGELEKMIVEKIGSINNFVPAELSIFGFEQFRSEGSTSGGTLSYVLRYAVRSLYGINISINDVECGHNGVCIVPGRNADFTLVTFTPPGSNTPTLSFAYAYGFRNIQNVIRKIKSKKEQYHLIEIMACPSGCINGGGQLKEVAITEATGIFKSIPIQTPEENSNICLLFTDWLNSNQKVREYLHTSYREVEKTKLLDVQW